MTCSFRLMTPERPVVGEHIHRDGWPWVVQHMRERCAEVQTDESAIPVDDFCEVWFAYDVRGGSLNKHRKSVLPHAKYERWCGVWHHPADIMSPIPGESHRELHVALQAAEPVLSTMTHAVCFCPAQREVLRRYAPHCKVLLVDHPVPAREPDRQWSPARWQAAGKQFFQSGFFLRDTRMIYRIPETNGMRARVKPYLGWHQQRDVQLKKRSKFQERYPQDVREFNRLDDDAYDEQLATSALVSHAFGAAANNVTLEAMSSLSPIITNRSPASEYYLGVDYPLLYDTIEQAIAFSGDMSRVIAAHKYMRDANYDVSTSVELFLDKVQQHCAA